jgi:ribonuclease P protein component
MQRELRLRRREDFSAVHRRGKSWANGILVIRVLPNGLATFRAGFSISKRVGKAVVRNRIKRRLREATRALVPHAGFDIVVIARTPAAASDYQRLFSALRALLLSARLVEAEPKRPPAPRPPHSEDV